VVLEGRQDLELKLKLKLKDKQINQLLQSPTVCAGDIRGSWVRELNLAVFR
jgi:hypothetical protein